MKFETPFEDHADPMEMFRRVERAQRQLTIATFASGMAAGALLMLVAGALVFLFTR